MPCNWLPRSRRGSIIRWRRPSSRWPPNGVSRRGRSLERSTCAGRGATGTIDGQIVRIGRPDWLASALPAGTVLPDATAVLTVDDAPVLAIDAADHARASARAAVAGVIALGAHPTLLSGDRDDAVATLAADVHVPEWRARLLPEDKAAAVTDLARRGPVLMVGDGINDGPALAVASVGLAVADGGTAVALEAADGALMHHDLTLVPYAIALGRATLRTVRVNVAARACVEGRRHRRRGRGHGLALARGPCRRRRISAGGRAQSPVTLFRVGQTRARVIATPLALSL